MERTETALQKHNLHDCDVEWHLSGQPFLADHGKLINVASDAMRETMKHDNNDTQFSTTVNWHHRGALAHGPSGGVHRAKN